MSVITFNTFRYRALAFTTLGLRERFTTTDGEQEEADGLPVESQQEAHQQAPSPQNQSPAPAPTPPPQSRTIYTAISPTSKSAEQTYLTKGWGRAKVKGSRTDSASSRDPAWRLIRIANLSAKSWVQMHLVSEHLGGSGREEGNLTPGTKSVNKLHERRVEQHAIKAYNESKRASPERQVIWLRTKVEGSHSFSEETRNWAGMWELENGLDLFRSSISSAWGYYIFRNSTWIKSEEDLNSWDNEIPKPKFSMFPVVINSKKASYAHLMAALNALGLPSRGIVSKIGVDKMRFVAESMKSQSVTQFLGQLEPELKEVFPKSAHDSIDDQLKVLEKSLIEGRIYVWKPAKRDNS